MAYRDIVVCLAQDKRSSSRLDAAIGLAERHEAKVTGVYVHPPLAIPGYASANFPPELLERLETELHERVEEAEQEFRERTAKAAVSSEWRPVGGDPAKAVTTSAHYADIAIVGQTDPDDSRRLDGFADSVVLGAGGPVLVWPYAGSFDLDPATVVLAWNGTREAKRALSDALPLLQRAKNVVVLGIDTDDGTHTPGTDICAHLARHGVKAEARHGLTSAEVDAGNALLNAISDVGARLLVMGAYGHHRVRELLLGGMTRDVLGHMTVPVLMSH